MTPWWQRWVNGNRENQHEPLPVDEYDDEGYRPPVYAQPEDNTPGWIRWLFNGGNEAGARNEYRPAGAQETAIHFQDDEQSQIDQAIRASLQEEALREDLASDDFALRKAMEASKKEAEEEAARRATEMAIVPAVPPQPLVLPDLMSTDPLPGDLLGPDPNENKDLLLLQDEALARSLQQEMNLLDDDGIGAGQHDMLSTLTGGERSGSLALPPGAMGLPAGWEMPLPPHPSSAPAFLALPAPSAPSVSMALAVMCGGCKQPISAGRYLTCLGYTWHPHCFRCKACNQVIVEKEFKPMGSDPYHTECHRQLFHPRCSVCNDFVPSKPGGVIEYRSLPFWRDQYCPQHDEDNTAQCTACHRLERRDTPYVDLADGRKLCLNCIEDVVIDTKACTPLYLSILHFYQDLGMPIAQEIPMLCVETQALNAAREGEQQQQGHHHAETKGLCLSEEQVIQTVVRLPGLPTTGLQVGQQTRKLHRKCEVTAILVLYGLPQVLTGSILAHELMHAYLKLHGKCPRLAPEVEEGICQVMAHLWLESQMAAMQTAKSSAAGTSTPASSYKEKFTEFCLHQIATNPSPVYGDGFRKAHAAVVQFGLKQTLDHIQLTGGVPEA